MRFTLATTIIVLTLLTATAPQPTGQMTGVAIPITKHSGLVSPDENVNMDALNARVASVVDKIRRGLDNYEKNTGMKHPSVVEGFAKRGTGVPLGHANGQGCYWHGTISVGTPLRPFTVLFDTGSSEFFLPNSTCDETCHDHTLWDPISSSTSNNLNQEFFLSYINGASVIGGLYTDTVSLAGFIGNTQTIGAATTYSEALQSPGFPADGLMGMAFQSISRFDASPVFQTLVSQEQVIDQVFSFKLSSPGAELYVGGSNSTLYTGIFTYVPVTVEGYWEVTMDNVQVDGQTILGSVAAIIDTGCPEVVGSSAQMSMLYDVLGGRETDYDGFYTFPCDSLPTIWLTFGGTSFPISPSTLNLGRYEDTDDCISGIVGLSELSMWIVGDVFLQNVYSTFDVHNQQVGFARLA